MQKLGAVIHKKIGHSNYGMEIAGLLNEGIDTSGLHYWQRPWAIIVWLKLLPG
jgi:hypothetical protein